MANTIDQQYIEKLGGNDRVIQNVAEGTKSTHCKETTLLRKKYIRKLSPSNLNMLMRTKKLKFPASQHDCKNTTISVRHKQK